MKQERRTADEKRTDRIREIMLYYKIFPIICITLINDKVITTNDLEEFSNDLKDAVALILRKEENEKHLAIDSAKLLGRKCVDENIFMD